VGNNCLFLTRTITIAEDTLETVKMTVEREHADVVIYNFYNRTCRMKRSIWRRPVFEDQTVFRGEGRGKLYDKIILLLGGSTTVWSKAIRCPLVKCDDTPFE
jgi:hypothetical protein